MDWSAPPKPAELAENRLIEAILENHFPIDTLLPAERDLANQLGVTRPTLREALQRLARDGWVEIHHGKPTRVRNYWREGNLGVLGTIARYPTHLPKDFISNLLSVRYVMAPVYTRLAVENDPVCIQSFLEKQADLSDVAEGLAEYDWQLHHQLTVCSNNPVYTLILNGFKSLYQPLACQYFKIPKTREHSRHFYHQLESTVRSGQVQKAESITRQVMLESLQLWQELSDSI